MEILQLSQLMQGSILYCGDELISILKIEDGYVQFKNEDLNYKDWIPIGDLEKLKPVKISENLLMRLGFEYKIVDPVISDYYFTKNHLLLHIKDQKYFILNKESRLAENNCMVEYVHNLQFVFYTETNEIPTLNNKN